jgi:hypothetical protein
LFLPARPTLRPPGSSHTETAALTLRFTRYTGEKGARFSDLKEEFVVQMLSPLRYAAIRPHVVMTCVLTWAVAASVARGDVMILAGDLQSLVAATQPGWNGMGLDTDVVSSGTQILQVTTAGTAVGITASLDGGASWNGRGLDRERAAVQGTSFNAVVSDLWFNRQMTATLNLTGLVTGTQYTVRAWHNDSYTVNEGAAAGGGTVTPSLVGGILNSATNGTVTNLWGTQSDAAFGITTLVFTSTAPTAAITFTRNGGSFTGIPMSGVQLTTAVVPEPATAGLLLVGAIGVLALHRRRRRTASGPR